MFLSSARDRFSTIFTTGAIHNRRENSWIEVDLSRLLRFAANV
ncbi:hypothetical protein BSU04_20875 [Caballeronia sordidicola]|uniref:Uncharacterized protein n=1 Tax=Caballeronia sordidicola TaxID=196367 RepID=A0A226X0D3_CABSO|nr:hypothetical protein BSU04_20875 [Caballeronia sordidicola]